jgi:toxin ParE1/3/4
MTKAITIRPKANIDLDDHFAYIAQDNLDMALNFFDAFRQTLTQLARMPGMGTPYRIENPRLTGLRKWGVRGFEKYLVFYLEREDTIEVIRLLHSSRDLLNILSNQE